MPERIVDEHLANMLARLERERREGGESVHLSRAEARAIYLLAFPALRDVENDDQDRLRAIIAKMSPVGWPK